MSQRLMFCNRLITKTDILRQPDSHTIGTRPPCSPPFLSPSDEEEKLIHGNSATEEEFRNKDFSKGRLLLPERSSLFIDEGGLHFEVFNPQNRFTSRDFGQPKRHNINRHSPRSLSHGTRIQRDADYKFQGTELIGMQAVSLRAISKSI